MSTSQPTAIVTGASRGFGFETAKALVANGWSVVIDGRDRAALEEAAARIGGTVTALPGDVSDPEHRRDLVAAVRGGRLDLLVNNASALGPSPQPSLADYPLDVLEWVYQVNVLAPLALTQAALPLLRPGNGVVINIISDAATEAYEGWGGYGSSKAALTQISNILAAEEPDLAVYAFDPGDMNTRMHQEAFPGEDISDRRAPAESVPPLLALVETRPPSGAYRYDQILAST